MTVEAFTEGDAARELRAPVAADDKYQRGVLGFATGSADYPGAALLGVEGALHTGVGMVRYVGPVEVRVAMLVRRPEVVFSDVRVDAWVVGSGMSETDSHSMIRVRDAVAERQPLIVDAGALTMLPIDGAVIATPHAGELSRLLGVPRSDIERNPAEHALLGAATTGATIVLKGSTTHIANPVGDEFAVSLATPWLATAGSGDVLAGIVGAVVASRASDATGNPRTLARLAAAGVVVHSLAARAAAHEGPFTMTDLVRAIPRVVGTLLAER